MVIRSRSFIKDLTRSIWKTYARFLSIMAIIALGVGFFAGINATKPDMVLSADRYYQDHALADFRLVSPLGFRDEDIAAVGSIAGVRQVQAGYSKDLFLTTASGSTAVVRVLSYQPSAYAPIYDAAAGRATVSGLNQPQIIEGRMPDKTGEIAIDLGMGLPDDMQIGSQLTVSLPDGESIVDVVRSSVLTVVGIIHSPLYVNYERGQTNIGDGSISYFVYLNELDFNLTHVTDLFVRTAESTALEAYSEAYDRHLEPIDNELSRIGAAAASRETAKLREELQDAKDELLASKLDAETKLADGARQLADAEVAISEGEQELIDQELAALQELADSRADLESGRQDLADGWDLYRAELARWQAGARTWQENLAILESSKTSLDDALAQITAGEQEMEAARPALDSALLQLDQLTQAREGLVALQNSLPARMPMQSADDLQLLAAQTRPMSPELAQIVESSFVFDDPDLLVKLDAAYESVIQPMVQSETDGRLVYSQNLAAYETGLLQLAASRTDYENGLAAYQTGRLQLDQARQVLDDGKIELDLAEKELNASERKIKNGEKSLADGEKDLQAALAEGREKLDQARLELKDGQAEYARSQKDATIQIEDAERQIREAERQMIEIPDNWFIMPRSSFPGYAGYGDDARRIGAVATIFPLFFFLVAALVCLTTMTRMVEEERLEIGTLKALGYGTWTIASKYLVYALLASLIGALIGLATGFSLLPAAIMNAYGMMYNIPDKLTPVHANLAVLSIVMAVATTVTATLAAALQELKAAPAVLMQPRAPRPGKRILIERIGLIWRHLSFSHKVTARNLFRYKKRMLMTVIGIAGCTGLLLTGFGIRDSVNAIMGKQFKEVFIYDAAVVLDPVKPDAESNLAAWLDGHVDVTGYLPAMNESISVIHDTSGRTYEANLVVAAPGYDQALPSFYDLHRRGSDETIALPDQGAVLSEKLADLLGVQAGDMISTRDSSDRTYQVQVAAIAENYLSHYIYLSPKAFDALTLRAPTVNTIVVTFADPAAVERNAFQEAVMSLDGVLGSMFVLSIAEDFQDTISSLDYVVIILILAAGALAFVVLYNLTNINITERVREIATIKVLGFRDKEVASYVYRENVILTLLGTLAGLGLGVLLHRFVMETMEIDNMMFGKSILGMSYVYSIILTMGFAVLVNIFMYYKLRSVNMVESLKSVE